MTEEVKSGQDNQKAEPTPAELKAMEQGWVPKDEWAGEGKWRDAESFLDRGELFQKIDSQNRKIKSQEDRFAALEKHYLSIQKALHSDKIDTLKAKKKEALIENDVEAVLDIDEKIDEIKESSAQAAYEAAQAHQAPTEPHPEFVAWTQRNSWYGTNKPMSAFADARGNELRAEGKNPSEVLRIVAEEVRKEFPSKFSNPRRDGPSSVEGGVSKGNADKGGKIELSEFETTIMKKLVGQGVLTKEQYLADIKAQRERS